MDPSISATNFVKALQNVDGWELLEPTIAANRVQRNADPYHYQSYWDPAVKTRPGALGHEVFPAAAAGCADSRRIRRGR